MTGSVFSPLLTSASLALTVTVSPTVASPSSSPTRSFSSPPSFPSLSAPVLVLSVSCFAGVLTAMLSIAGVEEEVSGVMVLASLLELSCNPVEHGVASGSLSVMLAANRAKWFSEREKGGRGSQYLFTIISKCTLQNSSHKEICKTCIYICSCQSPKISPNKNVSHTHAISQHEQTIISTSTPPKTLHTSLEITMESIGVSGEEKSQAHGY